MQVSGSKKKIKKGEDKVVTFKVWACLTFKPNGYNITIVTLQLLTPCGFNQKLVLKIR